MKTARAGILFVSFTVALAGLLPAALATAATEAPDNPDSIQVKLLSQTEAESMVKDAILRYHLSKGSLKCTGLQAYQGDTGEELVFGIVGLSGEGCPGKPEAKPVKGLIQINLRTGQMQKQVAGGQFVPVEL